MCKVKNIEESVYAYPTGKRNISCSLLLRYSARMVEANKSNPLAIRATISYENIDTSEIRDGWKT